LLLHGSTFSPLVFHAGLLTALTCAVALVLLRARQGSVLDRWVMIAVLASFLEMAMVTVIEARFTVGWYSVRVFGVAASAIVLIALLTETTRLYARLAAAMRVLERERDTRLANAHAVTAAITHEIRQPLAGLAASGGAGIRFLDQNPPDLVKARDALQRVVGASHRVSDIFEGISALFSKSERRRRPIDVNLIVFDVLEAVQDDAKAHLIDIRAELAADLPPVSGDGSQLREVVTNLVQNAFDAMDSTVNRSRVLRVKTQLRDQREVVVTVEDSGPGIAPDRFGEIFGAFVTTKAKGTGLGLAICRMIVAHHGGQLTVSSDGTSGAVFQFVLPFETVRAAEDVEEIAPVAALSTQAVLATPVPGRRTAPTGEAAAILRHAL
jgi:C4-dicarboxylate-specific signal transduction histidine kinase